jgi:Leucine-rich repeat (LRR) protein
MADSSGLQGSLPSEIGNLSLLESLGLSENELTGTIPSELYRLTNLGISSKVLEIVDLLLNH